jgi:hypothetical protein
MEDDEAEEELEITRANLDAVIDKFKELRAVHEAALANLEEEIASRVLDQREYEKAMEISKVEYEQHLRILKRAVESRSDVGMLASELFSLLTDLQMAQEDAKRAGEETEKRTAAQYSNSIIPTANQEAFEALLRIKTNLDALKQRLMEKSISAADDNEDSINVGDEATRTNLRLRILVFETFIDLITQHSRVGTYKGQVLAAREPLANDDDDTRAASKRPANKRPGFAINFFGNKMEI